MNTLTWRLLTAEELTRVYLNEMRRDFPPTELKPLSMVLNSEAVGDSHTWGVYDGETLVAYLLMVRPRGATVSQLDYFAVLPACRAAGLGAKLLASSPWARRMPAAHWPTATAVSSGSPSGGSTSSFTARTEPPPSCSEQNTKQNRRPVWSAAAPAGAAVF